MEYSQYMMNTGPVHGERVPGWYMGSTELVHGEYSVSTWRVHSQAGTRLSHDSYA